MHAAAEQAIRGAVPRLRAAASGAAVQARKGAAEQLLAFSTLFRRALEAELSPVGPPVAARGLRRGVVSRLATHTHTTAA